MVIKKAYLDRKDDEVILVFGDKKLFGHIDFNNRTAEYVFNITHSEGFIAKGEFIDINFHYEIGIKDFLEFKKML